MRVTIKFALCIFTTAMLGFGLHLLRSTRANQCRMTYMQPAYETESVQLNDTPYGLVRYVGDKDSMDARRRRMHPVLFVPGHKGNLEQVRSLGAHVARLGLDLEVYALDLAEEPTALHAGLLWQQARFTSACVRQLVELHPGSSSVLMVGHSLGGVVIRTALVLPSFPAGSVSTVLTLGTPHQAPPLHMDRSMATFYEQLARFWRTELPRLPPKPVPAAAPAAVAANAFTGGRGFMGTITHAVLWLCGADVSGDTVTVADAAGEGAASVAPVGSSEAACIAVDGAGASDGTSCAKPEAPAAVEATVETTAELAAESAYVEGGASGVDQLLSQASAARGGRKARARQTESEARTARDRRLQFANARLGQVALVSIAGGGADTTVPAALTAVSGLAPPNQAWHVAVDELQAFRGGAAGGAGGVDHLALAWCFQLQDAVARALNASAALPGDAKPQHRLAAMRAHLDGEAGGPAGAARDAARELRAAGLPAWVSARLDAVAALALALVSHRIWLVVPVWAGVGVLLVATVLLHALLGLASHPVPRPTLLLPPAVHFPAFLLAPAWGRLVRSAGQLPSAAFWAVTAASAAVHAATETGLLASLGRFGELGSSSDASGLAADGLDADYKEWTWYAAAAAAWCAGCLLEAASVLVYAVGVPCSIALAATRATAEHLAGPFCLYGGVLLALFLVFLVLESLQSITGGVCRAVVEGPLASLRSLKCFSKAWAWVMAWAALAKNEAAKTGDEMREAHRNKRHTGGSAGGAAGSGYLSASERWLAAALWLAFVGLHLSSLAPVSLRGLLSLDRSFAVEVAIITLFAIGTIAALLVSFVALPAYASQNLAR